MINLKETWEDAKYYWGQRRDWRQAQNLDDLALRSARWARGELGSHPSGYDVPDPETTPLLPSLARVNAAGLFTHQSQPGGRWEINGVMVEQRAFVSGYLARVDMLEFRRHLEGAGMLVLDGAAAWTVRQTGIGLVRVYRCGQHHKETWHTTSKA